VVKSTYIISNFYLFSILQFSALSIAELKELEKAERKAVETRIQAFGNIQTLINQSMFQFLQQYLPKTAAIGDGNGSSINGIIKVRNLHIILKLNYKLFNINGILN